MVYLITITDDVNTDLDVLTLGTVSTVQTFKCRVWNNRGSTLEGITDMTSVVFDMMYSPTPENTIVVRNDCFEARCTYSAKLDAVYAEAYKSFSISHADYDTIPSNKYNEYEIKLDMSGLTTAQKARINALVKTVFFRVNAS